jgi:ABC-2 type transport system ATP-binding protein
MIGISKLSIRYPEVVAVDNVSIEFNNGILYGLVGPNGAGKSSLLRAIIGLIAQYDGNITYDDLSLNKDHHLIKSLFGYAPEDPDLYPYLTGKEYLYMLSEIRKQNASEQIKLLTEDFGLTEVMDDLIKRYSHGMRQKLSFAAALIGTPQNIILDEALNGFDPLALFNAKKLLLSLTQKGHTVILSSHVLELVENLCQKIVVLNDGKLIAQYSLAEIEEIKKQTGKNFNEHFITLIKNR